MPEALKPTAATDDDKEGIVALCVAAFGEQDGPDVRTLLADDVIRDAWSVVRDGSRVVSAVARIDHVLQLDGMSLRAAQIEYVATDEAYQRRGLVAAQMSWHHQRCREEHIPLQLIGGIPYFYRRFGYGYGLDAPALFVFPGPHAAGHPSGFTVRDARVDDLASLVALEDIRPTDVVRIARDESVWRRRLAMAEDSEWSHLLVAEDRGAVVGWTHVFDLPREHRSLLFPSVARSGDAATALLEAARRRAADRLLVAVDSPGTAFADALRSAGAPFEHGLGYYTRIPDPVGMLERLRPLLAARLAASDLAGARGTLELSLYRTGVAVDYAGGEVGPIRVVPGVEDPTDHGGNGVAPDWFPALVLGRWGATELARRVDDVIVLRDHQLMDVFFPHRVSDVAADF